MFVWKALPIICFIAAAFNALIYFFTNPPYYPNEPVRDGIIFFLAGVILIFIGGHIGGGGGLYD